MGRKLNRSEIELILRMFDESEGRAREAERILRQEPYFSQELNFCYQTVINYWRKKSLPIKNRGGPNHTKRNDAA